MMRLCWVRIVHVKSPESHALRLLLTNRKTLQRKALDIENEIGVSLRRRSAQQLIDTIYARSHG